VNVCEQLPDGWAATRQRMFSLISEKLMGLHRGLKRARQFAVEDGTVRFEKNGRFVIKDAEGLIRSFGQLREPI
jgi:hypothetical protein